MKNSAVEQQCGYGHQQDMQNHNQLFFEVDADIIGESDNKEMRTISMDDYKATIERLYFR